MQRRASKCALGNIGQDMPYEERLNLLKWPTLEQRRQFSSLIECYKTLNSLNGLDPSAFFTFANDFRPLRANHRFKLKLASATLNSLNHSFFYTHNRQVEQFAKGNCGGGKFEYF